MRVGVNLVRIDADPQLLRLAARRKTRFEPHRQQHEGQSGVQLREVIADVAIDDHADASRDASARLVQPPAGDLCLVPCFIQFAAARGRAAVIVAELRARRGQFALGVRNCGVLRAQLRAQRIALLAVARQRSWSLGVVHQRVPRNMSEA